MDIPGCVSNPSPADAATDIPIGVYTFTWDAPTDGGTVASYDVYGGDSATTLQFIANTTGKRG